MTTANFLIIIIRPQQVLRIQNIVSLAAKRMNIVSIIFPAVYFLSLVCLLVYGLNCYFLMIHYRLNRSKALDRRSELQKSFRRMLSQEGWPRVTVQLPIFNERYVVRRLISAVCRLDYPRDRLDIQVLDDSTDETAAVARDMAAQYRARGVDIVHMHRQDRRGFKAGALSEGFKDAKGEFVVIFDADFKPRPDFLKRTIPYFTDKKVGMLQARWGHLNPGYSLLTRAQSIGIDGHFGVEQASRAWSGFFMNFNGTAGIWRKQAIEEAGGWQADTLTEDLDLSYRAQLKGWKLMFAPEVVCPAELPPTITAFKSQQFRWAKGSIQTARKNLGNLFRADLPLVVKIQALLHLTHYMVHPIMLLVVVTSIPMLSAQGLWDNLAVPAAIFTLLALATFGPSSLYVFSQRILYPDWRHRVLYLPFLMCLGTGIAVNNTKAVLEALLGIESGFIRTPKYGITHCRESWKGKSYALPLSGTSALEFLLGCYSFIGLVLYLFFGKFLVSPFLLIYTSGFFYVFILSVRHGIGRTG